MKVKKDFVKMSKKLEKIVAEKIMRLCHLLNLVVRLHSCPKGCRTVKNRTQNILVEQRELSVIFY